MGGCGPCEGERTASWGREPGATVTLPDSAIGGRSTWSDEVCGVSLADAAAGIIREMHEAKMTDRIKPFLMLCMADGVHPRRWTRVICPWPWAR